MEQFDVTAKFSFKRLKIYINGVLHASAAANNGIDLQSWVHEGRYCIELYSNRTIRLEYTTKEKWLAVLKVLDENI